MTDSMKLTSVLVIIIALCLIAAIFWWYLPRISSQKSTDIAVSSIPPPPFPKGIPYFLYRNREVILVGIVIGISMVIAGFCLRVLISATRKEEDNKK